MSEVEKQPENAAAEQNAAPAAEPKAKDPNAKVRIIVELAVLVLAVIAVCIVGEARKLTWWCYLRAKLGSATMSYNLAKNYEEREPKKARMWLEKAASRGHIKALRELADKDPKWMRKLAEKGDKKAMLNMALACRRDGKMDEAIKWYEKAAAAGVSAAMHSLGVCYYEGTGVGKDVQKAKEWLQKAKDKGYGPSEIKLEEIEAAEKQGK